MLVTQMGKTPTGFARGVSRSEQGWYFPFHQHHGFLELVFLHEGEMVHTIGEHVIRQKRGDLVLIRDFDGHELNVLPGFGMTNLQVTNLWLRQIEVLWENSALVSGVLAKPAPLMVHLSPTEQTAFEQALEGVDRPPHPAGRRALFSGFLIQTLLRYFADPNLFGFEKARMPEWLESTISWIHRHREEPLRVADVVEHANKCPEHVSRSFREHLKMTPSQYLNRQRLDYAAELLAGTNYPLLEVCYRAGFETPSYFHRQFKRTFGESPIAYRRSNSHLA